MPLTDESLREFYSVCESCGRQGHEGRTADPVNDPECLVCLPLRLRVGHRDAPWILQRAMEKLGRLEPVSWLAFCDESPASDVNDFRDLLHAHTAVDAALESGDVELYRTARAHQRDLERPEVDALVHHLSRNDSPSSEEVTALIERSRRKESE